MPGLTLSAILRENGRSAPQSTALICGDHRSTYASFARRTAQLAAALRKLGLGRGDRVVWLGQNCHRWLEALGAASTLGALLCPLNWRATAAEQLVVLRDIQPALILWQREGLEIAALGIREAFPAAHWIAFDDSGPSGYEALVAAETATSGSDVEQPEDPERALLMLQVLDAAGVSSGALLSHTNLLAPAPLMGQLQQIDGDTVNLVSAPLYHIASLFTVFPTLLMRGANVFVRRADAIPVCEAIDRHRCTHGFLLGPTAEACARENAGQKYDLSSFRSSLPQTDWRSMVSADMSLWGKYPGGYGQTETNMAVLAALSRSESMTSGKTAPYAEVRIVDPTDHDVPSDTAGEIIVRGASVHQGYWDRMRLNAERFKNGWWHTRDLGRRNLNGTITFLGPMGRLIKSGAENIYAAEIERCLSKHPGVAEAAVIGVPDPIWVQSVKAIVVANRNAVLTETDLLAHCREHLASYKKPKFLVIQADPLPRAGANVDYQLLDRLHGGGGYPGEGTRSA